MKLFFYRPQAASGPAGRLLAALEACGHIGGGAANGERELAVSVGSAAAGCWRLEDSGGVTVVVAGDVSAAARGIGAALAGARPGESGERRFKTFGILLDSSRNFVFNPDYLKRYFAALAMLGCNLAMIYTKDAYRLDGEPWFGYLRGGYTAAELRELDDFADALGIELIGAIQALGHLEPVLRWPACARMADTPSVLLTSEPESYLLIAKMLDFFSENLRSRRIHLGMDETHDLGRGRYMDLNGYKRGFDIYNDHLAKVMPMCSQRGLSPMIWSDMFFRMGSRNLDYYDPASVIPADVAAAIPPGVQLAYWDYYHTDRVFYADWIGRHLPLAGKPVMTSGIWTWSVFWYDHATTCATVEPCLAACREQGVDEVIFALWADDGGYCDWGSALAGVAYAGGMMFPGGTPDTAAVFRAVTGGDYDLHLRLSRIGERRGEFELLSPAILWDDPLLQIYWKEQASAHGEGYWPRVISMFDELLAAVGDAPSGPPPLAGDPAHAHCLLEVLVGKLKLMCGLRRANCDAAFRRALLASGDFEKLDAALAGLEESFRRHWYGRGRVAGFEVMQIRLAGQRRRWEEAKRLLSEGAAIAEIDEAAPSGGVFNQYKFYATASYFI